MLKLELLVLILNLKAAQSGNTLQTRHYVFGTRKGGVFHLFSFWLTPGLTYKVLLDEQSAIVHIWRHSKEDVTSILIIILLKAYRNLEGKVRFYRQLFLSEQTDLCPTKCSQAAADP